MSHETDNAAPVLRRIELVRSHAKVLVAPACPEGQSRPFEPFALPRFSRFLADWLIRLGKSCWHHQHHPIGVLLLLDVQQHAWSFRIPEQKPGLHAVTMRVTAADMDDLPTEQYLAGSFQSICTDELDEIVNAVPVCDGLHLVQNLGLQQPGVWSFLSAGPDCWPIKCQHLLLNDWELLIQQLLASERLTRA